MTGREIGNRDRHAEILLSWYDVQGRTLPWRYKKGDNQANPYHVWLSEMMLQQTTVKAVIPYFKKFLELWPTVGMLAEASLDDVLTQWAGLGYYARARNLHKCAIAVVKDYGGIFPASEAELLKLPGIGPYTSAAIAAIAFGQRAVVVDGNVERVVSRIFRVELPLPDSRPALRGYAAELTPPNRSGDYAQAMMDLGAVVCTSRSPSCLLCPVSCHCQALASGVVAELPRRKKKAAKPRRSGACFFVLSSDGHILLGKRPDKGLLAKMAEVPGTEWAEGTRSIAELEEDAPFQASWVLLEKPVLHVFTHFHLTLQVFAVSLNRKKDEIIIGQSSGNGKLYWVQQDRLAGQPLPSVMQKVVVAGQEHAGMSG